MNFFVIEGDVLLKPIIEAAGKDITHWFDKKTKDVCIPWKCFSALLLAQNYKKHSVSIIYVFIFLLLIYLFIYIKNNCTAQC